MNEAHCFNGGNAGERIQKKRKGQRLQEEEEEEEEEREDMLVSQLYMNHCLLMCYWV